jgi:hypothetical protein
MVGRMFIEPPGSDIQKTVLAVQNVKRRALPEFRRVNQNPLLDA